MTEFDAEIEEGAKGKVQVKRNRGIRTGNNTTTNALKYETVGKGFYAQKREEERKKAMGETYIEKLEKRSKMKRVKKTRHNISMEEIQAVKKILRKLSTDYF